MSAHDEAAEAAAWAVCSADGNDWDALSATYNGRMQQRCYLAQAVAARDAYLAHMAAAGWKLTPREATKEMAISALNIPTACPVQMSEWLVELARGEWSAMHDAAPSPEEAP